MLLVEQNVHLVLAVSDYAFVLNEGKVWAEGPAREVARSPQARRAYLEIRAIFHTAREHPWYTAKVSGGYPLSNPGRYVASQDAPKGCC